MYTINQLLFATTSFHNFLLTNSFRQLIFMTTTMLIPLNSNEVRLFIALLKDSWGNRDVFIVSRAAARTRAVVGTLLSMHVIIQCNVIWYQFYCVIHSIFIYMSLNYVKRNKICNKMKQGFVFFFTWRISQSLTLSMRT